MYTYVQWSGCKKQNTATYVHTGGVSNAYSRIVWPGLVYMAGSERKNCIIVVFMGRQRNASCSSGGNGTCVVRREPTSLDGTADGNEAWHTVERRKRPCVRPATFETGSCSSGGVWRTAKRGKQTSYGRNRGPVDRERCGVPQNKGNGPPTVETRVLLIRRGVAYRKKEETDFYWSATVEIGVMFIGRGVAYRKTGLHGILFIYTVSVKTGGSRVGGPELCV